MRTIPQIMTDTLKSQVQPFHIPNQFSALVKSLSLQLLQCCREAVGERKRGGQKKAAKALHHMTPVYKSTRCHQQQRALDWEGEERGRGVSSPSFSSKSLCSKVDPDLIIDRELPPSACLVRPLPRPHRPLLIRAECEAGLHKARRSV